MQVPFTPTQNEVTMSSQPNKRKRWEVASHTYKNASIFAPLNV